MSDCSVGRLCLSVSVCLGVCVFVLLEGCVPHGSVLLTCLQLQQLQAGGSVYVSEPCVGRDGVWNGVRGSHRVSLCPSSRLLFLLLPSSRHHLSNCDCLEDKRENYRNCSVLCSVRQLYTMICTHMSSS